MSSQYFIRNDLSALDAMEILYQGENNGVWQGDFIKNEKTRNIKLCPLLKEFLSKYGYLSVNRSEGSTIYHPDDIEVVVLDQPYYKIGLFAYHFIFVPADEMQEDPYFYIIVDTESSDTNITRKLICSGVRVSDLLKLLFCENMRRMPGFREVDDAEETASIAEQLHLPDIQDFLENASMAKGYHSIHYDEEKQVFLVVQLDSKKNINFIWLLPFSGDRPFAALSLEELHALFAKKFYQESMNCDYAHVLRILEELIARMEGVKQQMEGDSLEWECQLAEKYQIAGTCCWRLNDFDAADEWYRKASVKMEACKETNIGKVIGFYTGQGSYFAQRGMQEKSGEFFQKAMNLCCQYTPDNYYQMGRIYQTQGENFMKGNKPVEAVEFYNKALEIYQKDPKDCKYDIARCQQLRGEARRKVKDLQN